MQNPSAISKSISVFDKIRNLSVVRYGFVGIFAASTHAIMASLCNYIFGVDATLSNFIGFLSGALISYFGSYYFTFRSTQNHSKTAARFGIVWLIGIAINVGLFKYMASALGVPFALNLALAIIITPIAQYLMLRFWAFKPASPAP